MATTNFLPCIDRFGQFKYRDWPGKVRDEAELKADVAKEEADLAAHPGPADWDEYGGWAKGPQLRATGRFRAEKVDGEFHFGAWDRGLFGSGLINKGSQEGRAAALKKYVESALGNPQIVGVHWHQFSDQPVTGRFDGEFFQVGWTDVCDRPYPETIGALRELAPRIYGVRAGSAD